MSIIKKANESVDLVKNALDVKVALATAEDRSKLADAKLALADLKTIIADLKEENQKLNYSLKTKQEFVLDKGVKWQSSDKELNQPFCPVCLENGKQNPLQKVWSERPKDRTPWKCPNKSCNAIYNPFEHAEPSRSRVVKHQPKFHPDHRY